MPLESSIAPKSRLDSLVASLAILSRRQTTAPASTRREPSFAALGTIAAVASRQNMGRLLTRERPLWVFIQRVLARRQTQRWRLPLLSESLDLMGSPVRIRNKCTELFRLANPECRNLEEDDVSFNGEDFDQVVEKYHLALGEFMKGNSAFAKKLYSQRDDVTLGNPFGPFARGWKQVVETMEQAALNYRDGGATGFESIAKCVTSELACLVEVERLRSKVGGQGDVTPLALRATSVFRSENGLWKIVHRHADPITAAQPADSVLHH